MFKRQPKHVFTCPDVIYLQQKAKRNKKIILMTNFVLFAGLWAVGVALEQLDREAEAELETIETPSEN
jgi:hypothetical protein